MPATLFQNGKPHFTHNRGQRVLTPVKRSTIDLRAYNCVANMLILRRLALWLLERLVEVFLLGALVGYLLVPNFTGLFSVVWALAVAVGVVLFMHGYYVTTAFFGVVWRSAKWWLYPAISRVNRCPPLTLPPRILTIAP